MIKSREITIRYVGLIRVTTTCGIYLMANNNRKLSIMLVSLTSMLYF